MSRLEALEKLHDDLLVFASPHMMHRRVVEVFGVRPVVMLGRIHCTEDVASAQLIALTALPDFWITSGLCYLTGHATLGPDYNKPDARERLMREWDEAACHAGWSDDLGNPDGTPADPRHQAAAILRCACQALRWKEQHSAPSHPA